jgi:beta-glucosidase-like glycosyl hydrolase
MSCAGARFAGVTVSDAMNMGGAGGAAGSRRPPSPRRTPASTLLLVHAAETEMPSWRPGGRDPVRRPDRARAREARERIHRFRGLLGRVPQPALDVVGCGAHRSLAQQIAEASVTLVRDPGGVLPLAAGSRARIAVLL